MTQRRRRTEAADAGVRVVLVLLLLGLAAQGLASRRNLEWDAIADAPGDAWIGIAMFVVAGAVVALSVRTLLKFLRASRREDDDDDVPPAMEERSLGPWLYIASILVVGGTVVAAYFLLKHAAALQAHYVPQRIGPTGTPRAPGTSGTDQVDRRAALLALLAGGAVALAAVHVVLRRRATAAQDEEVAEEPVDDEETEALAGAVAAAEEELATSGDDTRAAIIGAYRAMERQLELFGAHRERSDTPTEFLLRATATARVSRGAAERLTDLFREARYSSHPMPRQARDEAARALARIADDLSRPRV